MEELTEGRYRALTRDECFAFLAGVPIGRVAISFKAIPEVLPVSFVLRGADIVFPTVPGSSLHQGSVGAVVAFEADHFDPVGQQAWSVLVRGRAHEVTDVRWAGSHAAPGGVHSWAIEDAATTLVRIDPELVTGRCLVVGAPRGSEAGPSEVGPLKARSPQ